MASGLEVQGKDPPIEIWFVEVEGFFFPLDCNEKGRKLTQKGDERLAVGDTARFKTSRSHQSSWQWRPLPGLILSYKYFSR